MNTKVDRLIQAQECFSCGMTILVGDDAGVCTRCGGRNLRVEDDPETRSAVATVAIGLVCFAVGLLMGSAL